MEFDARKYKKELEDKNISVIYIGPIWANGIDGIAEMLLRRLEYEEIPMSASQAVFSIFVEQMNNMMMYSAEKEKLIDSQGNPIEISKGIFMLGVQDSKYFIQTGNAVTSNSAAILKERIDYLNTLNKSELRQYHRECLKAENTNPESHGAGLGLTEIARRANLPIEYRIEPFDDKSKYFTMYITIQQGGK